MPDNFATLYDKLYAHGIMPFRYSSDLYLPGTDAVKSILEDSGYDKNSYSRFRAVDNNEHMLEIPFIAERGLPMLRFVEHYNFETGHIGNSKISAFVSLAKKTPGVAPVTIAEGINAISKDYFPAKTEEDNRYRSLLNVMLAIRLLEAERPNPDLFITGLFSDITSPKSVICVSKEDLPNIQRVRKAYTEIQELGLADNLWNSLSPASKHEGSEPVVVKFPGGNTTLYTSSIEVLLHSEALDAIRLNESSDIVGRGETTGQAMSVLKNKIFEVLNESFRPHSKEDFTDEKEAAVASAFSDLAQNIEKDEGCDNIREPEGEKRDQFLTRLANAVEISGADLASNLSYSSDDSIPDQVDEMCEAIETTVFTQENPWVNVSFSRNNGDLVDIATNIKGWLDKDDVQNLVARTALALAADVLPEQEKAEFVSLKKPDMDRFSANFIRKANETSARNEPGM